MSVRGIMLIVSIAVWGRFFIFGERAKVVIAAGLIVKNYNNCHRHIATILNDRHKRLKDDFLGVSVQNKTGLGESAFFCYNIRKIPTNMRFLSRTEKSIQELSQKLEILVRGRLWLQVIIALLAGLGVGILLGPDISWLPAETADLVSEWLALPGELFLRLIKMVLIPLVMASIIRGLGTVQDAGQLRSVGARFALFVILTSLMAAFIGVSLARVIEPGQYVKLDNPLQSGLPGQPPADFDVLRQLPHMLVGVIPENPLASAIEGEMLGVVIFSILFAIALCLHRNTGTNPVLKLASGILEICMTIVKWAMLFVPWAVFGLTARMATQVGIKTLVGMSVYVSAVLLGLLILLVFYYLLAAVLGGRNPVTFARDILSAQLLAFSTSSSAAVMPLSIQVAEEKLKTDTSIAHIIIPLGATVNMAGTALYQSVAVLFLAQMSGVHLEAGQLVFIVLTLVASSIGSPATPGVGTVILSTVVTSFGIPASGLVLILGVDRILDMCRTSLNVTGDLVACAILGRNKNQSIKSFLWFKKEADTIETS